jgi:hypothetical protein
MTDDVTTGIFLEKGCGKKDCEGCSLFALMAGKK